MSRYVHYAVACIVLVSASHLRAAYVVHEFDGRFEHGEIAGPVVPVGSAFLGLFAFEQGADRVDEPFNGGVRSYYSPIYVELTVGSESIRSTNAQVQVRDAVTQFTDAFILLAGTEVNAPFDGTLNGNEVRTFAINLGGWLDTFGTSDYPVLIDLDEFQGGNIHLLSGPLSQTLSSLSIRGGVENLMEFTISEGRICATPTCVIPEPTAAVLVASGLVALAAVRWRRRGRRQRAVRGNYAA